MLYRRRFSRSNGKLLTRSACIRVARTCGCPLRGPLHGREPSLLLAHDRAVGCFNERVFYVAGARQPISGERAPARNMATAPAAAGR